MGVGLKRVILVVVVALIATLTAAMPAPAQTTDRAGGEQPGLGGPIVDGAGGLEEAPDAEGVVEPGEVLGRRTERSRTFVTDDGTYQTTFYDQPVHFRDSQGAWQPIDTTLVPEPTSGSLRTKASSVEVSLPAQLGAAPVRVATGSTAVEFSLRDATAAPAKIGVPAALPAASAGSAGSAATYAGARPGVDVAYTALPEGVKEELVLAGPLAPSTYDFTVRLSPGLSAEETPDGGVAILSADGTERAAFAPPFVTDASHVAGEVLGEGPGYSTEAVSLRILERAPELVLRLAVDPAWLAAPERAWPVVVDPTLTVTSANDTYLGSGAYANTNYGTSTVLGIGGGTTKIRALHQRELASFFTEPAVITAAALELYVTNDTSGSAQRVVAVHEVSAGWASTQATWNNRLSSTPWAQAGGDFDALALWKGNGVIGSPGWRSFPVTRAAQGWVDGTKPNNGVVIKYVDEAAGPQVSFASANATDATKRPRLVVNWEPLQGLRDAYAYQDFDLGEAGQAKVNLASGNLSVSAADVPTPGSGLDALVRRFYNSRAGQFGSLGARWSMWPQSKERLYEGSPVDLSWRGGPPERAVFSDTGRGDRTFTSPHGYPADLAVQNAGLRYVMSHANGIRNVFYASGYPDQIVDAEGDTATFGYVENTSGEWEMASMTDSVAGVVRFERIAPTKVSRVIDPAGRSHRYGYTTDGFGNTVLESYTDPASRVTRYGYEGRALLKTMTDPTGKVTTFGSDADGRLTSFTRDGKTWRFDYTTPWQTTVTDPEGNITTHRFDRRGRITRSDGPPFAPTNLRAVPGDGQAALSWEAARPNGSPVTGYTLTASPGGATTTVAGDATSATFSGLTNDTAYTFTVVATNAIGNSVRSAPSNEVTPSSDPSLLAALIAPTDVVATRGDTQAQVSWTRPLLTLPLLTTFDVTTHRASDGAVLGTTSAGTGSSVTVTGLKNGTPVYFTVTARSLLIAATSEPSNTITPAGPPFAPTDVAATRGDRQVEVRWNPPGPRGDGTPGDNGDPVTSYTVTAYRAEDNAVVRTIDNALSPLVVPNLTNGNSYYFTVRATNGIGTGPESVTSNDVTPAGRPFPPTNVAAVLVRPEEAEVSWTAPNDNGSPITSYTVTASPDGATVTVPEPLTSATIDALAPGSTYTFTVVATNDVGNSDPSAPSNSLTVANPEPPSTPTNVTAVARNGAAAVSWDASHPNDEPVTYTVTASPGGTSRSTMGTSTVVDGLTNGVEYTFTVQAWNSAGTSERSAPSNPVTPWVDTSPPPPPDSPCLDSSLPDPPDEVYLPSGAVQRQITVPCRPEMGRVRIGFFIEDENVRFFPDGPIALDGDGRGFDPNMAPDDNRIYLELDYSTGTGFIQSNRSCADSTEADCTPARSLKDAFESYSRADGSIFINFTIGNSRLSTPLKISADLDILPVAGGLVCVTGAVSRFPAVEAYYDKGGETGVEFQLHQSDYGAYSLGFPHRDLPPCLSREMP